MSRVKIAGLGVAAAGWAALIVVALAIGGDGRDAMAYYNASLADIYANSTFLSTGFVYSPAFAVMVEPFRWVDPVWLLLMIRIGSAIALGYLVTPWLGAVLIIGQFPGVREELGVGNLDLVTAAILVLVLTRPWLWATLLLTKVTPGVGLVWHLARREWRALAVAGVSTIVVVVAALPWMTGAWTEWMQVLTGDNLDIADAHVVYPLWARGLVAVAIVALAAATDRAWLVPIAVAVSFPNPNVAHWLVMLAIPRMWLAGTTMRQQRA